MLGEFLQDFSLTYFQKSINFKGEKQINCIQNNLQYNSSASRRTWFLSTAISSEGVSAALRKTDQEV
jgi:hypothetical protein